MRNLYDTERDSTEARRWHHSPRMRKARLVFLAANPLCVFCARVGRVEAATVVDHKIPHKGDYKLFWDRDNWQGLCKQCHDRHKQALEKSGRYSGCDLDGNPVDENHLWNVGRQDQTERKHE